MTQLTKDIAEKFASLALAHVGREYPNKMDRVLTGPDDVIGPRAAHPVFFGSFDWHSCVHGYWLLARVLRRHPDFAAADAIRTLVGAAFTVANVEVERANLDRPASRGFERPYGWGWLLALHAEMEGHPDPVIAAAGVELRPLALAFARRFREFLPLADYPVRTGVHTSTAFALRMAADFADRYDPALFGQMQVRVVRWYAFDRDCQAWEPSQDDFLSPALMEAECMRRFLRPEQFRDWFATFLPRVALGEPASLFVPARVSDRSDGKIAHLDGLNLSRAWCWRNIAAVLAGSGDDATARKARETADGHIAASLPHVAGDYMGEHWLATFALLALEAG